jgi:hypothetical protein
VIARRSGILAGGRMHRIHEHRVLCRVARWFTFKPQNPDLGKFLRALDWKMLIYIWNILRTFMTIWYGLF